MTQQFIGVKQVQAWEQERDGKPGYAVKYPDGYTSWSPREVFEKAYFPMGFVPLPWEPTDEEIINDVPRPVAENINRITQDMVNCFVLKYEVKTIGEKTTVVQATLRNGFEIVESSSCVDVANYDEQLGAEICVTKIKDKIWHLLGFTLQWARTGMSN